MSTAMIRFHERPERGFTKASGMAKRPMMTTASGRASRQWSSATWSGFLSAKSSSVSIALFFGASRAASRGSERVFFVDKLSEGDKEVNNVFVQSTERNRMGVMVAQRGYVETAENGDRFVVLLKGRRYEGTPGTLDYRTVDFDRYALRIEPREAARQAPPNKAIPTLDLWAEHKPEQLAELHWRLSLPLAVVIMALVAVPLAFVNPRSGRSWNLILAVLIYALYNNLLSIFQAWTAQGKVAAWVGLWPVHLTMIVVMLVLFSRQLYGDRWLSFGR